MSEALSSAPVDPEALFKAYRGRIYRYVLRLVRNAPEAQDITQETFLRVHRSRDTLRDPGAVRTWLYRIATHVCLDRLRQRKPHVAPGSRAIPTPFELEASDSPSVLKVLEQEEMSACVQGYLDRLSDSYRAVILLHDLHSLTAPQMAELLGVRVGTVKTRLHRARCRLREALKAGCAFSHDERGVFVCRPKPGSDE